VDQALLSVIQARHAHLRAVCLERALLSVFTLFEGGIFTLNEGGKVERVCVHVGVR
jgi:hypothetical protein